MSAKGDIRAHAEMFNWQSHLDRQRQADTFVRGANMVTVNYRRDGTVEEAYRYEFYKVDSPQLRETAGNRHKWSRVVAWLVQY